MNSGTANTNNLRPWTWVGLLLFLLQACASPVRLPHNLPGPTAFPKSVHGAWIVVTHRISDSAAFVVGGELLAIELDSGYYSPKGEYLVTSGTIHIATGSGYFAYSLKEISEAWVVLYKKRSGKFMIWALVGAVSTVTHGYGLVISAPVWVLSGILITVGEGASQHNLRKYPKTQWSGLYLYARFPQGVPPGVDLSELESPYHLTK